MPNIELSPRADEDIRGIWLYSAETWSIDRANTYVDALSHAIQTLAQRPERGRRTENISDGLRRLNHASHAIFYRVIDDNVRIVRVLHASMDFAAHFANDET